jgi:hypothetical protein
MRLDAMGLGLTGQTKLEGMILSSSHQSLYVHTTLQTPKEVMNSFLSVEVHII